MNCLTAVECLSPDLDGALADADALELRRHLAACPDCARKRAVLDQARAAFRTTAAESRSSGYVRAFALAAALTMLVVLGNVVVRMPASPPPLTNATAGIDCGLPDGECIVADPCADQRCAPEAMLPGLQ